MVSEFKMVLKGSTWGIDDSKERKVVYGEFDSIAAFEKYINETPLNEIFRWAVLGSSQKKEHNFNATDNFEEALNLLKSGWGEKAKELEKRIQIASKEVQPKMVNRMQYDVVGFQASVPRYLQGVPQSMINKKPVVQKQKVITIVKHIGFLGNVKADVIMENSIKALMIVKKLEAQGYRINLDVISPSIQNDECSVTRIRIKHAADRLNISKVAFPMVHPDMLRRMIFRFRETAPNFKNGNWVGSYGSTIYDRNEVKKLLKPTDYYLHNFIEDIDKEIENFKLGV